MCSAQELHTYTDFEIDQQYFFSAFSQLHEVFLKYDHPIVIQFPLSMMISLCVAQNLLWFGKAIREEA